MMQPHTQHHPQIDKSWAALSNPGNSSDFFSGDFPLMLSPSLTSFSVAQAWTLSEISRLTYYPADGDVLERDAIPSRRDILQSYGLHEIASYTSQSIHCTILKYNPEFADPAAVLAFRGTQDLKNWLVNLDTPPAPHHSGGKCHRGFQRALEEIWPLALQTIRQINVPIFYTGHSLGGALAEAAATMNEGTPTAVYTFGAPRFGDSSTTASIAHIPFYRVVHSADLVPSLPPRQLNYTHSGELHFLSQNGEHLTNPPKQIVYAERGKSAMDFKDLGTQFMTLSPPKSLYDHSPINYTARLYQLQKEGRSNL